MLKFIPLKDHKKKFSVTNRQARQVGRSETMQAVLAQSYGGAPRNRKERRALAKN